MNHEKKNNILAIAGTVSFHALLLLVFMNFALRTPLPLPDEEGVEVSLGNSDAGMGTRQQPVAQPAPVSRTKPLPPGEELVTQKTEETPAIPAQKEIKKEPKPQPRPQPQPNPEPEPPRVDPRAMYRGKTQETQTDQGGSTTSQVGDRGRPDGSPDGPSHEGSGGAEEGISYNLSGRSATLLPRPDYPSREQGRVVVTIWVDREGRVVRSLPGSQGTTTSDPALRKAADEAALRTRFSPDPSAPHEQKGAITYIFLRQN